jgi:hypothetical protein
MPTPKRRRPVSTHPQSPLPDPEEGVNPRLPDEPEPADVEHVESEEEQQARDSEAALDKAATRMPPD